MKIKLNLNNSLEYDSNGKLRVKRSAKTGNTLTIESDGLYAPAIPGKPGSSGTGYPDGYRSANGVMSGVTSPYNTATTSKRIVGPSIMHRIFTCGNTDGSDISLRDVDYLYPGDMYRVKDVTHGNWNYYIILSVNNDGKTVRTHTGEVAIIPLTKEDVN